jgi:hypothetical protein
VSVISQPSQIKKMVPPGIDVDPPIEPTLFYLALVQSGFAIAAWIAPMHPYGLLS